MINAVVFDCFGVLVTDAWRPFKAKYFANHTQKFQQATDISHRANRGLISHQDFIRQAAELAGISFAEAHDFISRNVADGELFDYIAELKKDYKIGFLSNVAANYLSRMFSPEQLAMFDAFELSYESGWIKPQVQAYELIAKKLDVELGTIIMIDDSERNVAGAREAGMQAVVYTGVSELRAEIARLEADSANLEA